MLAAGLSILFLLAIRLAWGWHAHRAFERAIAEIKQRGEPIEPEDFDGPEIPDEENAALVYLKAIETADFTDDEREFIDNAINLINWPSESMVWGDAEQATADQLETKYSNSLRLIRTARSRSGANWGQRYRSPMDVALPQISGHRWNGKLLSVLSAAAVRRGEPEAAAEFILDSIIYMDQLDNEPSTITHLVAMAGFSLTCQCLEDALPRMPSLTEARNLPNEGGASTARKTIEVILRKLLDESRFTQSGVTRMCFERAFHVDAARCVARGQRSWDFAFQWASMARPDWWQRAMMWPVAPVFLDDGRRAMVRFDRLIAAIRLENWPAASVAGKPNSGTPSAWMRLARPLSATGDDNSEMLQRVMMLRFRALAIRRMAATAVAIRLFQEDYGRRPESLEELVPKYLPAVPRDPMAENDAAIRYLPNASPPILYSVNENGVDDGGRYLNDKGELEYNAAPDFPYFLDGRPALRHPDEEVPLDSSDKAEEEGEPDGESDVDDTDDDESGQTAPHVDRVEDQQADPGDAKDEDQRPE